MEEVTIVGAGHQGLAMAAHLSLNKVDCYLWNRSREHIRQIVDEGTITSRGVVEGTAKIKKVSTDIREVLKKVIMITTPSSAHNDLARMLAPLVSEENIIILNPGRTFGALNFICNLKKAGCKNLPIVAETQTIVYTCRRSDINEVEIFALKNHVEIAAYKKDCLKKIMDAIPTCLRTFFIPVENYMQTSLSNVGMVLHCAPLLMNVGWVESNKVEFKYYYDGISKTVADVLEKIDHERVEVASAAGIQIDSVSEWLKMTYSTHGDSLYECLQNNRYYREIDAPKSLQHRYVEEDVPNGLVAIESLADYYDMKTPVISTIINFANIVMNKDYRIIGRNYRELTKNEI